MTKAYPQELRERVIASVKRDGLSRREAARRYRIGEATAVRWLRALSEGRRHACPRGGDRRSRLTVHEAWLLALAAREPELSLADIAGRLLDSHSVTADAGMLSRFYNQRGISFRKRRSKVRAAAA
jgi:transposase